MTSDREKANRTGVRGASEPFDDAGSSWPDPSRRDLLDLYQFSVVGPSGIAFCHSVLVAIAAIGRYYPSAVATAVKDANHPGTCRPEQLIGPSLVPAAIP
jgi:hypothetical protein